MSVLLSRSVLYGLAAVLLSGCLLPVVTLAATTSDGLGTPTAASTTPAHQADGTPVAPTVTAMTLQNQDTWYNQTTDLFSWHVPSDVTAVAVEIATSSQADPKTVYKSPIDHLVVKRSDIPDGISYLSINYKNKAGWGAITHRKLMIDTVPPEPFTIQVHTDTDGWPRLTFATKDTLSGIDHYVVEMRGRDAQQVSVADAKAGYRLTDVPDGSYPVTVIAYDKAGNHIARTKVIAITAGWSAVPQGSVVPLPPFLTVTDIFIATLLIVVFVLWFLLRQERREHRHQEYRLRTESAEVHEQMQKIFTALRDEIYDQINAITKRPRLTKKEQAAIENLTQALEVSETLIEKEMGDVEKLLHE